MTASQTPKYDRNKRSDTGGKSEGVTDALMYLSRLFIGLATGCVLK